MLYLLIAVFLFVAPVAANAQMTAATFERVYGKLPEYFVKEAFGNCGDPCVIPNTKGGLVPGIFGLAGHAVGKARAVTFLIADDVCQGPCVLALDYARPWSCIGPHIDLAFFRNQRPMPQKIDPPHSPDVKKWVRGKMLREGRVLPPDPTMSFFPVSPFPDEPVRLTPEEARQIFTPCSESLLKIATERKVATRK